MRELVWGLLNIWNVIKDMVWQIGIVVLLVVICRLFVGRVSKQASYLLWFIVAVRLICPVMIPSEFSIFNMVGETHFTRAEIILSDIAGTGAINQHYAAPDEAVQESPMQDFTDNLEISGSDMNGILENPVSEPVSPAILSENELLGTADTIDTGNDSDIAAPKESFAETNLDFIIWLAGAVLMFAYGIFSYGRLKYKLRFATRAEAGVFESNEIFSPFVFGIVKPVIYLPYHLNEWEKSYILAHERYHIRRRDYLIKLFAYGLLSVYWFHPFVWIAFYLMGRDMEMSCDEQVLKGLGKEDRKAYSTLLLGFASHKRFPLPSPLSFGENDTKSRVKQILNYKKPTFWGAAAAAVLIIAAVVCCLTDAKEDSDKDTAAGSPENVSELPEETALELAEMLYNAKNPYIGDISANVNLLNLLCERYGITGKNGTQLQTYAEPYWITIGFDMTPDNTAMWKVAAVFLALTENCSEFRWEYYADDILHTYYVDIEKANETLECENIKDYGTSVDGIRELLTALEEKGEKEAEVLVSHSALGQHAEASGISWDALNQLENRMISDGIRYRGDTGEVYGCAYEDFDDSGSMDFAVLTYDKENMQSVLYVYMNDDSVYAQNMPIFCWDLDVLSGDIDHDGSTELVYISFSGGNGGAGSHCKGILKYENHTLTPMEMPGDFSGEELEGGEAGYHINVFFGKEKDTYEVVCPAIDEYRIIDSEYAKDENGNDVLRFSPGVEVGANCRGFSDLSIIHENGRDYLMGKEYFHGEGGVNDGVGMARFLFDWSDTEGWLVRNFDVIPFGNDEEGIFEQMKAELEYYPSEYEDMLENESLPVIDYENSIIIDSKHLFSGFAQVTSENLSAAEIIYAQLNEKQEPVYVYIQYRAGIYYYLADYTRCSDRPYGENYLQATYTDTFYVTREKVSGKTYEYFCLTNEEDLTSDDIMESLLSSSIFPLELDFVTVYFRELTEEEIRLQNLFR